MPKLATSAVSGSEHPDITSPGTPGSVKRKNLDAGKLDQVEQPLSDKIPSPGPELKKRRAASEVQATAPNSSRADTSIPPPQMAQLKAHVQDIKMDNTIDEVDNSDDVNAASPAPNTCVPDQSVSPAARQQGADSSKVASNMSSNKLSAAWVKVLAEDISAILVRDKSANSTTQHRQSTNRLSTQLPRVTEPVKSSAAQPAKSGASKESEQQDDANAAPTTHTGVATVASKATETTLALLKEGTERTGSTLAFNTPKRINIAKRPTVANCELLAAFSNMIIEMFRIELD